MNEILFDEINEACSSAAEILEELDHGDKAYKKYLLISDDSELCDYTAAVLCRMREKGLATDIACFVTGNGEPSSREQYMQSLNIALITGSIENLPPCENTAFLFFVNTRGGADKTLSEKLLRGCIKTAARGRGNKLVVCAMLPEMPPVTGGIHHLSEREYSYYIENCVDKTENIAFYLNIERACREAVRSCFENIGIVRFDNIFGPGVNCMRDFDISAAIDEIFDSGNVTLTTRDYETHFTCMYARDAVSAIFHILFSGDSGNVFNASLHAATPAVIKDHIYQAFIDRLEMTVNAEPTEVYEDYSLSSAKLRLFEGKPELLLRDSLQRMVCTQRNIPFDIESRLLVYNGRLPRIKELEIEILREIDRICTENGINWFLAGGSLLGAVRNKKSIAWDDDLDIGMLREDFEKFRKIAPDLLDKRFVYSSPFTGEGHYYLDKVRLADTYFSTLYSNHFIFRDGVFVDIIVYDKTSNIRMLEKLQIFLLQFFVRAINIRWYNYPRRNICYWRSKFGLPIMRMFKFITLHKMFDRCAMMFHKSRRSKYLIDGLGQHIHYGRFPKECLAEYEYSELDGMKVPIPKGYDEYLSFFYGPDYINNPPLSSRLAAHRFSRIDLGEYVFDTKGTGDFRGVNINGELFEDERAAESSAM